MPIGRTVWPVLKGYTLSFQFRPNCVGAGEIPLSSRCLALSNQGEDVVHVRCLAPKPVVVAEKAEQAR